MIFKEKPHVEISEEDIRDFVLEKKIKKEIKELSKLHDASIKKWVAHRGKPDEREYVTKCNKLQFALLRKQQELVNL